MSDVGRIAAKIRHLAARQQGHVTRSQLLEVGLSSRAISRRIEAGELVPVHAGVYAVGYVRIDGRSQAAAAVLACGKDAVLSHESAAALWGMVRWPRTPHVTAPTNRKRPGIHTHRCSTLTRRDITRHHGIRVTSPARTALDIAPRIGRWPLTKAVNDAENAGWLRRSEVLEILARRPRAPGADALRYVIGAGKIWSRLEYDFAAFAAEYGLPRPRTNVKIAGYTVDVLFEPEKVIVELDGWDFHRDRASFEDQRERDAATLHAGFITIRLTWERLHAAPGREARRMHEILRQRRGQSAFGAP